MASDLSDSVVGFLRQHVGSIELLEVLLLLNRRRERSWDADAVAAELRIQPRSAASRLVALAKAGIVTSPAGLAQAQRTSTGEVETPSLSVSLSVSLSLSSAPPASTSLAEAYVFNADGSHVSTIAELEAAYQSHRVRVIETIFAKPVDNRRAFADAFVFGGKGPKRDG